MTSAFYQPVARPCKIRGLAGRSWRPPLPSERSRTMHPLRFEIVSPALALERDFQLVERQLSA